MSWRSRVMVTDSTVGVLARTLLEELLQAADRAAAWRTGRARRPAARSVLNTSTSLLIVRESSLKSWEVACGCDVGQLLQRDVRRAAGHPLRQLDVLGVGRRRRGRRREPGREVVTHERARLGDLRVTVLVAAAAGATGDATITPARRAPVSSGMAKPRRSRRVAGGVDCPLEAIYVPDAPILEHLGGLRAHKSPEIPRACVARRRRRRGGGGVPPGRAAVVGTAGRHRRAGRAARWAQRAARARPRARSTAPTGSSTSRRATSAPRRRRSRSLLVVSSGASWLVAFVDRHRRRASSLGAVVEFLVIRRFFRSPRLILTVATIGLAQVLAGLGLLLPRWFDVALPPQSFPAPIDASFTIDPAALRRQRRDRR